MFLLLMLTQGCSSRKTQTEEPAVKASADSVSIPTNAPQLGAITVESVESRKARVVPLTGRLIWNEDATVRVFTPFAGIVQRLPVEVNDHVNKGAPLAEIRSADFGQALADARKADSDFRRAERALNRARDLVEHGAAPRKDLESAEADFASAQAEKERTRMRLEIYGASTESTNQLFLLPSPLDGVVVEKNVTPGQEIRPDQILANAPQFTAPLFTITDPSKLWIQIDATEADLPYLRPGREFAFVSRAFPDQTFTGRVDVVSEFIDPNTRTIKVRGSIDNSSRELKAEMFVNVNVPAAENSGPSVPTKAVFLKGEKHYVFVENEPGQFTRKEVQIGAEHNGRVAIMAGMQPGQRVVTEGCLLLQQSLHE
jgi:cobalt-zinc-cadmium efflux system membrane fusion protein